MTRNIETILLLLAVLVVVDLVARRLKTAPSILLVIAGIGLALTPGLPRIELAPELVLLGILPPLIYSAGVAMSWREFRFNLRPITLLAFGCVIFTTCAVAAVAHWLLGLPLAVGFVLGVPRRLLVVLEGEGLANDATALVLYRFAVAAIGTGLFSLGQAAGTFALIVIGEIAYGIVVGWLSLRLRRWAHDPRVEITLSLLTPYVAFLVPEQLGGSGVLATVATGLYVSWNGPLLIPAATRLQGIFFWDLVVYFLEGFVFLVTGMETRALLDRAAAVELRNLAFAILSTVVVVVVARFVWVFPATYLPRWLSPALRRRDPLPPWQWIFILAFVGVRGVVSLAAALAIPLTTATGAPFPDRNLILLVAFGVIIMTLIGNGLSLPTVVRLLGLANDGSGEREREQKAERAARTAALNVARERLEGIASDRQISTDILSSLRTRHEYRLGRLPGESPEARDLTAEEADLMAELIAAEREHIYRLLQNGQLTDEARRRIERDLDLEEASLATFRKSEPDLPL